jgi:lysozyme family protein
MADVDAAIIYVLRFEDSTLSGKITVDDGGPTRFGIASRYHPELTACGFYKDMGSVAALQIAKSIYDISYAQPLSIEQIANQDIANKLLSLGVNIGVFRASKMLQSAVGITEDGVIGVNTLMRLSGADPLMVLADLRAAATRYYHEVVAEHPEDEEYLNGWLARANA